MNHIPQVVDLAFRLRGTELPVDHGYLLFAAISRRLVALHEASGWGVHPVRDTPLGNGALALSDGSRLVMRLPTDERGRVNRCVNVSGGGFPLLG